MMKILWLSIFCAGIFTACSNSDHAGVLSETESGESIAGMLFTEAGTPAAKAAVYIVREDFNAAHDTILAESKTAEDGSFVLETQKLSAGNYSVLFENADENLAAKTAITLGDGNAKNFGDTLNISATILPTATVAIPFSEMPLDAGDTLCLTGTLVCKNITASDKQNGVVILSGIPAAEYNRLEIFGEESESVSVSWKIESGSTFVAKKDDANAAAHTFSRTLADLNFGKLPNTLDSVPFSIWLLTNANHPLLVNEMGDVLPSEKIYAAGDSSLYRVIIPQFNYAENRMQKISQLNAEISAYSFNRIRYAAPWDSLTSAGIFAGGKEFGNVTPDSVSNFEIFQDGKFAISFWMKLDKNAFGKDSSVALFTAMQDSLGFVIRQNRFNNYKSIGVELFVNADTVLISDTTIYGSAKILDGNWHYYAVILRGDHIHVMLDGKVIHNTDFNLAKGFGKLENFVIGDSRLNGIVDELKIYDGTQDTLWMRSVYEMERPEQNPWNEI